MSWSTAARYQANLLILESGTIVLQRATGTLLARRLECQTLRWSKQTQGLISFHPSPPPPPPPPAPWDACARHETPEKTSWDPSEIFGTPQNPPPPPPSPPPSWFCTKLTVAFLRLPCARYTTRLLRRHARAFGSSKALKTGISSGSAKTLELPARVSCCPIPTTHGKKCRNRCAEIRTNANPFQHVMRALCLQRGGLFVCLFVVCLLVKFRLKEVF